VAETAPGTEVVVPPRRPPWWVVVGSGVTRAGLIGPATGSAADCPDGGSPLESGCHLPKGPRAGWAGGPGGRAAGSSWAIRYLPVVETCPEPLWPPARGAESTLAIRGWIGPPPRTALNQRLPRPEGGRAHDLSGSPSRRSEAEQADSDRHPCPRPRSPSRRLHEHHRLVTGPG